MKHRRDGGYKAVIISEALFVNPILKEMETRVLSRKMRIALRIVSAVLIVTAIILVVVLPRCYMNKSVNGANNINVITDSQIEVMREQYADDDTPNEDKRDTLYTYILNKYGEDISNKVNITDDDVSEYMSDETKKNLYKRATIEDTKTGKTTDVKLYSTDKDVDSYAVGSDFNGWKIVEINDVSDDEKTAYAKSMVAASIEYDYIDSVITKILK